MNYWMAIGPEENWKIGLKRKIWGLPSRYKKQWQLIEPGDVVFLYITAPIRGIVGYGTMRTKEVREEAIWPEEKQIESALWPLHIAFETDFCLETKDWEEKAISISGRTSVRRAFQRINVELAKELLSDMGKVK